MEFLIGLKAKLDKKTEFYALRVKNKNVEKTSGFRVNDEDNPDTV
jgi:hypothetical protein